jgi:hypothetical protein
VLINKVKWRLYGAYFSIEDVEILIGERSPRTDEYYRWLLIAELQDIRGYMAELLL